jgi:hydroxymethylbilane synthase
MSPKPLRIGTRKSPLAVWQAKTVQQMLEQQGQPATLVRIDSDGDQNLTQPLYAMGIQGIFTKALDTALLNNTIDIAVHSLKDVPTQLPQSVVLASVLERENVDDVLVFNSASNHLPDTGTIATSSLRRKAQWLHKYPNYTVATLRGNVQTRLEKIESNNWTGALFAAAGLSRLSLLNQLQYQILDWMLPAPGQGAIGICCHQENTALHKLLQSVECSTTRACVTAERTFLRVLEGGCSAPIGVRTHVHGSTLEIEGGLFSIDGKQSCVDRCSGSLATAETLGQQLAEKLLHNGGAAILEDLKKS